MGKEGKGFGREDDGVLSGQRVPGRWSEARLCPRRRPQEGVEATTSTDVQIPATSSAWCRCATALSIAPMGPMRLTAHTVPILASQLAHLLYVAANLDI